MIVVRGIENLEPVDCSIVTVGVFDGVHIGHQKIMGTVRESSEVSGCGSVVVTFDRNPEELVDPARSTPHILTLAQKLDLIEQQAISTTLLLPLDMKTLSMSPEAFVTDVISVRLSAVKVVVGTNFAFGKDRVGNVALLQKMGAELGFEVIAVPPVTADGTVVSSTNIRKMIQRGDVEGANTLLGHPFIFEGTVVHGQEIGRTLGFPTANVMPIERQVVPGRGIYAVTVRFDGRELVGVCNIGTRPTVEGKSTEVEVHILDFADDVYGRKLDIAFHHRLRNEIKFASLDDLVRQINCDIEQTRRLMVT